MSNAPKKTYAPERISWNLNALPKVTLNKKTFAECINVTHFVWPRHQRGKRRSVAGRRGIILAMHQAELNITMLRYPGRRSFSCNPCVETWCQVMDWQQRSRCARPTYVGRGQRIYYLQWLFYLHHSHFLSTCKLQCIQREINNDVFPRCASVANLYILCWFLKSWHMFFSPLITHDKQ